MVKLREDEVSSLSTADSYSKLIAAFINEAKEEVENAWRWTLLQDTHVITTVASQQAYTIDDFTQEYTIDGVFNATSNVWMRGPMSNWRISQWDEISGSTGTPLWWDIFGVDADSNDPNMRLWPTPDGVTTINVYGRHSQAYLETSTDSDTVVIMPWKPVVYGAYAKALSERGEDGGQTYDEAVRAAENALSDAVALDVSLDSTNSDWHNDELHRNTAGYIGLP